MILSYLNFISGVRLCSKTNVKKRIPSFASSSFHFTNVRTTQVLHVEIISLRIAVLLFRQPIVTITSRKKNYVQKRMDGISLSRRSKPTGIKLAGNHVASSSRCASAATGLVTAPAAVAICAAKSHSDSSL